MFINSYLASSIKNKIPPHESPKSFIGISYENLCYFCILISKTVI